MTTHKKHQCLVSWILEVFGRFNNTPDWPPESESPQNCPQVYSGFLPLMTLSPDHASSNLSVANCFISKKLPCFAFSKFLDGLKTGDPSQKTPKKMKMLKASSGTNHTNIWGFPKIGVPPKSSILIGFFHCKPSILGYPYFWKHPFGPRYELPSLLVQSPGLKAPVKFNHSCLRQSWGERQLYSNP